MLVLHRVLLVLFLAAAVGGLIHQAPPDTPALVTTLVALVIYGPVFVFVRPAWRADPRQLLWFCILLMFYFSGYTAQIFSPAPLIYWVVVRLVLLLGLFTTASLLIRKAKKGA